MNWKNFALGFIGVGVVLFLLKTCVGAKGPDGWREKVTVEKVTLPGEITSNGDEDPDTLDTDSELSEDVSRLLEERKLYFERYRHYKSESAKLKKELGELSAKLQDVGDCEGLAMLQAEQLARYRNKASRDSAVIEELFAEFDTKGKARVYKGKVDGEHYSTEWEATVFGILPKDGLRLKTDVVSVTTTIEKPFDVWRKNSFEAFVGYGFQGSSLGLGYERRGKVLGIFGQGEYLNDEKKMNGRAGLRVHF